MFNTPDRMPKGMRTASLDLFELMSGNRERASARTAALTSAIIRSMKFLISVIDDLGKPGTPEEMVAIDAFNDKLRENGHWIFAGGLAAPVNATVIDNRDGAGIETGESHFPVVEHYSGCWIVSADNLETARELAYEGSLACNRKVELRPFLGN